MLSSNISHCTAHTQQHEIQNVAKPLQGRDEVGGFGGTVVNTLASNLLD